MRHPRRTPRGFRPDAESLPLIVAPDAAAIPPVLIDPLDAADSAASSDAICAVPDGHPAIGYPIIIQPFTPSDPLGPMMS